MKKMAMVAVGLLSLGCLGADENSRFALNVDSSVGFSTEFVQRGRKQGKNVFTPSIELSTPVLEKGKAYLGCDAFTDFEGGKEKTTGIPWTKSEIDPYIGISYAITDTFTLDAGYVSHFYVNNPKSLNTMSIFRKVRNRDKEVEIATIGGMSKRVPGILKSSPSFTQTERDLNGEELAFPYKKNSHEIYLGVMADALLSPSLYFFYDFDCQEVAVEGQVSYACDLGQFGLGNTALELGAKLGFDNAKKPFGLKNKKLIEKIFNREMKQKGYLYYGIKADLVYSFSEHAKARAGVEFAGNSAKKGDLVNLYANNKYNNFAWLNASLDCSF